MALAIYASGAAHLARRMMHFVFLFTTDPSSHFDKMSRECICAGLAMESGGWWG